MSNQNEPSSVGAAYFGTPEYAAPNGADFRLGLFYKDAAPLALGLGASHQIELTTFGKIKPFKEIRL